jgi:hypothetical protein
MIHTISIDSTRKKLMTGGAVLRLAPGLSAEELIEIGKQFLPGVVENNVNSMVLAELARCPELPKSFVKELENLGVESISLALNTAERPNV